MEIAQLIEDAKLPSPAPIVLALYDAIERDGAQEIATIIEADPALTARLLRLANSAFYSSSRVTHVRDAIVRVGVMDVAAMLTATEVVRIFYGIPERLFSLHAFWEHSLLTACYSRVLSRFGTVRHLAPLWVCGLLHDIGKLLLVRHIPVEYVAILAAVDSDHDLLALESERLGFTHAELGERLLRTWRLPEAFALCAGQHHENPVSLDSPASIVAVANALAKKDDSAVEFNWLAKSSVDRVVEEGGRLFEGYRSIFAEYLT